MSQLISTDGDLTLCTECCATMKKRCFHNSKLIVSFKFCQNCFIVIITGLLYYNGDSMMMNIFENIILLVCVLDLFSIEITIADSCFNQMNVY